MNITRFEYMLALERIGTMTGVAKAYYLTLRGQPVPEK